MNCCGEDKIRLIAQRRFGLSPTDIKPVFNETLASFNLAASSNSLQIWRPTDIEPVDFGLAFVLNQPMFMGVFDFDMFCNGAVGTYQFSVVNLPIRTIDASGYNIFGLDTFQGYSNTSPVYNFTVGQRYNFTHKNFTQMLMSAGVLFNASAGGASSLDVTVRAFFEGWAIWFAS